MPDISINYAKNQVPSSQSIHAHSWLIAGMCNLINIETQAKGSVGEHTHVLDCADRITHQKTITQTPYTVNIFASQTNNTSFGSSLNSFQKKSPGRMKLIAVEPVDPTNESTDISVREKPFFFHRKGRTTHPSVGCRRSMQLQIRG